MHAEEPELKKKSYSGYLGPEQCIWLNENVERSSNSVFCLNRHYAKMLKLDSKRFKTQDNNVSVNRKYSETVENINSPGINSQGCVL